MVYEPKRKTYVWGEGYRPKVKPDIVGGVLEQINAECGSVTSKELLDRSRPEDSPTHDLFEWDDNVAAEAYRLEQSRYAIRHLRVIYEDANEEKQTISAFVNIAPITAVAEYQDISVALSNQKTREAVFSRIRAELDAFIERNKKFDELGELLIERGRKLLKTKKK